MNILKKIHKHPYFLLISGMILGMLGVFLFQFFFEEIPRETHQETLTQTQRTFFPKKISVEPRFFSDIPFKIMSGEVEFPITSEGKEIISQIKNLHKSPNIIDSVKYDEALCAGYIWGLTEKIWGETSPYYIGMMHPTTKVPAKAWELPWGYEYRGGTIHVDYTDELLDDPMKYWEIITPEKIENFFYTAFLPENYLGDIGFYYRETEYGDFLRKYYLNSHIGKNFWVTNFSKNLPGEYENFSDALIEGLSCNVDIFSSHIKKILPYYEFFLEDEPIFFYEDEWYYLDGKKLRKKVGNISKFSHFSYEDITVAHYFHGANVDSLLEMTCQGDFFPMNIMEINPRFLEKIY